MNSNFWDHLINAAGHLMDASARDREEREAERAARASQRKPKATKSAPTNAGFDANDPSCCVARRRIKVKPSGE